MKEENIMAYETYRYVTEREKRERERERERQREREKKESHMVDIYM